MVFKIFARNKPSNMLYLKKFYNYFHNNEVINLSLDFIYSKSKLTS